MSALPRLDLRLYLTAADILCALHRGGSFRREGSRWVLTPPGEVSVQVPGAAARLLLKKCWIRSLPPSRGEVVYYAKV